MKNILMFTGCFLLLAAGLTGCYYDQELEGDASIPKNVSLSNDLVPIFEKNCAISGCHDQKPTQAPSLIRENAYYDLTRGGLVNVSVPTNGKLYEVLAEGNMPPGAPLTSREMNLIIGWLNEGARNN